MKKTVIQNFKNPGPAFRDLCLGIERPEVYYTALNGSPVCVDSDSGWWFGKSLRRIPVTAGQTCRGENELKLVCQYDENHPGLEIIYLLGNFGVLLKRGNPALTSFLM